MTDLTPAENDAMAVLTREGFSHPGVRAAVRAAIARTERRYEQCENARLAILLEELTAIRDIAYRGTGSPADAIEAIHQRASRVLAAEGNGR